MLWNELDFDVQREVLIKILNMADNEDDSHMKKALFAAFLELRMWSNSPCQVIDDDDNDYNIVQAQDPL
jgi:hypothetical protein